jgi:Putative peptidoglycan binding domain/N-acetylmuramoyl-L-alanine amidase
MSLKRVSIPSPNYSSRGGSSVRLIVLHTAEGATTYQSLGSYFKSSSSGVSSHVGIDDTPNTIGEYVQRSGKAWTSANANPVAIQAELCAFAKWTSSDWSKHQQMLKNTAQWIAEEAKYYGIPITKLSASQAQGSSKGVCQHADLGTWGGNHWDCGKSFPMDQVLSWAKGGSGGSTPAPAPTPPPSGSAPKFPYPSDNYLGVPDGTKLWHDGHGGGGDSTNVRTWQQKMKNRGWSITVDGRYGSASQSVCKQFQSEKGLGVDGKVGPKTWNATWNNPVT